MSSISFTYGYFLDTRNLLLSTIKEKLSLEDRQFLYSIKSLVPNWNLYAFSDFPSIKWKIQNLKKLKSENPNKYDQQLDQLKSKLGI